MLLSEVETKKQNNQLKSKRSSDTHEILAFPQHKGLRDLEILIVSEQRHRKKYLSQ